MNELSSCQVLGTRQSAREIKNQGTITPRRHSLAWETNVNQPRWCDSKSTLTEMWVGAHLMCWGSARAHTHTHTHTHTHILLWYESRQVGGGMRNRWYNLLRNCFKRAYTWRDYIHLHLREKCTQEDICWFVNSLTNWSKTQQFQKCRNLSGQWELSGQRERKVRGEKGRERQ